MNIILENLGKKFRKEWIFKNLNYHFEAGKSYAITGANGSGKSTFLQIISGFNPASLGSIDYLTDDNITINPDKVYKQLSLAAPYLDLNEDFTLLEQLNFHFSLKPLEHLTQAEFITSLGFDGQIEKKIKYFSSGMKQKLKLGLTFYSKSDMVFIDEPTSNLDEKAKEWYFENIKAIKSKKLLIIASNEPSEYEFVDEILNITKYKPI